jgi:hypothetical protein
MFLCCDEVGLDCGQDYHVLLDLLHARGEYLLGFLRRGAVEGGVEADHFGGVAGVATIDVGISADVAYPIEVLCEGEEIIDGDTSVLIEKCEQYQSALYPFKVCFEVAGFRFHALFHHAEEFLQAGAALFGEVAGVGVECEDVDREVAEFCLAFLVVHHEGVEVAGVFLVEGPEDGGNRELGVLLLR